MIIEILRQTKKSDGLFLTSYDVSNQMFRSFFYRRFLRPRPPQVECLCSTCRTPHASRASETQNGLAPPSAPVWPPPPSCGTPWPSASSRRAPAGGSTAAEWGKAKKHEVFQRVIVPVCHCQRSEVRGQDKERADVRISQRWWGGSEK